MAVAGAKTVVLLHGLYQAQDDPFSDLTELEQAIQDAPCSTLRFHWPAGNNNLWALRVLRDRNRSLADELAKELDAKLRSDFRESIAQTAWALVGHSAGGLAIYRWLTAYSRRFYGDGGVPPGLIVTMAAPYQCTLDLITLNGKPFDVHEPAISATAIFRAVPKKLLVCVAGREDVLDLSDVLLPSSVVDATKVDQQLIDDSLHAEICRHSKTQELVAACLRAL